jgi:hypothetical protein
MSTPVKVGDVVRLEHEDYCYGQGPLHLRITKVGPIAHLRDGPWLDLEGIELRADGSQLGRSPRQVQVRMSALRGAVRNGLSGPSNERGGDER